MQFFLIADTFEVLQKKLFNHWTEKDYFVILLRLIFKVIPIKNYQALLDQSHIQEKPSNIASR